MVLQSTNSYVTNLLGVEKNGHLQSDAQRLRRLGRNKDFTESDDPVESFQKEIDFYQLNHFFARREIIFLRFKNSLFTLYLLAHFLFSPVLIYFN